MAQSFACRGLPLCFFCYRMKASIATEEAPYEWVIPSLSWKFSVFEFDEEEEKVEEESVRFIE
jgi:hypothetical protein